MRTVGGGAHIPGQAASMPNVKKRVMKRGSHARKRRLQKGWKESAVRGMSFAGAKPTGQPGGTHLERHVKGWLSFESNSLIE